MRHHIGSAIVEAREPSPDQEDFLGYLQDHGVTLLNTWHAKPAYTCQTGDSQTQIDFILCREQHADKTAKDSKPWHQAPVGKWKTNHHIPVWASVRHVEPERLPQKKLYKSYKTTLQGSVTLHDQQARQLKVEVERKVQELTATGNIEEISASLDQIMLSTIAEVYPPDKREDHRLSQDPQVQLSVKEMWKTYAKYREAKTTTFMNIFAKWRQYALFHKPSRAYKAKTKEVKKERILQTAQELWPKPRSEEINGNFGSVPNSWPHGSQGIARALGEVLEKFWPRSNSLLSSSHTARRNSVAGNRISLSINWMRTSGLIQPN